MAYLDHMAISFSRIISRQTIYFWVFTPLFQSILFRDSATKRPFYTACLLSFAGVVPLVQCRSCLPLQFRIQLLLKICPFRGFNFLIIEHIIFFMLNLHAIFM